MAHDRRVHAGIPARPNLGIITTDAYTPLVSVFHQINAFARSGRIHALFILAHGKGGFDAKPRTDGLKSYMAPGGVCMDAGGMGISLGSEGIRHQNVNQWSMVRNRIDNIVVYSCAAADTQPGNEGTLADGKYLMGALAIQTRATVYAATKSQYMSTYKGLTNGRFILEGWQGDLLQFLPSGDTPVIIDTAKPLSFEFSQVMDGYAP